MFFVFVLSTDRDPCLGSWPCVDLNEAVLKEKRAVFLFSTDMDPSPVWIQEKKRRLFSSRNELCLVQEHSLGIALGSAQVSGVRKAVESSM